MSGGYGYGDLEPKERCPYCGASCHADFVDIGVGYQQCGPYHCEGCGASEIGAFDNYDENDMSMRERQTGWYEPGKPAGQSANVDPNGRHISYFEADTLYRQSCGVEPRYDSNGRLKP